MKYKVTFENGQVSTYDTKTPFEEFKGQFTTAAHFEQPDAPAPVVEPTPAAEAKPAKKSKKAAE